jgi:peptidoglycan/LPS O-acetylase OafA/YrhL
LKPFLIAPDTSHKYRPDIDGLRAIAVLSVVSYHAFPSALTGGFVGVDVFFVISGFLITSILIGDIETHSFSPLTFYARRIRRIFPALAVCLAAVLIYGSFALMPSEFALLGKHVFLAATFLSNVGLWYEAGYFDTAANFKPLLHLWSLGVEEQFYILWPIILWISFRAKANTILVIAFLFLLSFTVNISLSKDVTSAFYLPIGRFWELLAGAAAVWLVGIELSSRVRLWLSVAGITAIFAAAAGFTPDMRFPGWLALLPALGTFIIILAGPAALVNNHVLSRPVLVRIGLLSYPLYVWHWPLISFAYVVRQGKPPTPLLAGLLIGCAFLLAWITFRFVEKPVRLRFGDRLTVATAVVFGALGLCGMGVWANAGIPQRFPPLPGIDIGKIVDARLDADFKATPGMNVTDYGAFWLAHLGRPPARKIVLSGDSVLFHYGPRVQQLADDDQLAADVFFVTGPSCPPVPHVVQHDKFEGCRELVDFLVDLVRRETIKAVVLGASWNGYGSKIIERDGHSFQINQREGADAFYANLEDYVSRLQELGAEVYLVLPVPNHRRFDPATMVTRTMFGFDVAPGVNIPVETDALRAANEEATTKLRGIKERTGAILLNPLDDLCEADYCSAFFEDGKPKFSDGLHLRPAFVRQHLHFLDELLAGP